MDWSDTQAHILTGGGALSGFTAFAPEELPHHHLLQGTIGQAFAAWRDQGQGAPQLAGCWSRPLFTGGWKESTDRDTTVFNVQTGSLFVDLRVPTAPRPRTPLEAAAGDELRLLARQHCFAGFSRTCGDVCTRHHCIDWNFHPDKPRPKPNKWRWQLNPTKDSFKEYGVAEDAHGQALYMERWALRPSASDRQVALVATDWSGVFVVAGDWFAFALDRPEAPCRSEQPGCSNLVDSAVRLGALDEARQLLSLEGSAGTVAGWRVVASTFPWTEGGSCFQEPMVPESGGFRWRGRRWAVFEASCDAAQLLAGSKL